MHGLHRLLVSPMWQMARKHLVPMRSHNRRPVVRSMVALAVRLGPVRLATLLHLSSVAAAMCHGSSFATFDHGAVGVRFTSGSGALGVPPSAGRIVRQIHHLGRPLGLPLGIPLRRLPLRIHRPLRLLGLGRRRIAGRGSSSP